MTIKEEIEKINKDTEKIKDIKEDITNIMNNLEV